MKSLVQNLKIFGLMILAFQAMSVDFSWSSTKSRTSPVLAEQPIGQLPYSNQWIFDARESYLYVSIGTLNLKTNNIDVPKYHSHFSGSPLEIYSIDYFKQLKRFSKLDSNSSLRHFSLWGRYSFGFNTRNGNLYGKNFTINSSVENSTLLTVLMHVGLNITYEKWKLFQPYLGFDLTPYFYRHSASLSGGEIQGYGLMFGPVLGAHFPLFFDNQLSFIIETRYYLTANNSDNTYSTGFSYLGGLGLSF